MPWKEFSGWRDKYSRDPWGTKIDDRRHVQICTYLHQIMNNGLLKGPKLKVDDLYVSKFSEHYKEVKNLLHDSDNVPWLDDNKDDTQRALEGQALLKFHKQKYGKKQ